MCLRRVEWVLAFVLLTLILGAAFAEGGVPIVKLEAPVLNGRVLPDGMRTELSWEAVSGAYEYFIQRDITPSFTNPMGVPYYNPAAKRFLYIDEGIQQEMVTLYYRVKALPSPSDAGHDESEFSNIVVLTPIDPTPQEGVSMLIDPAGLDFQTFIFHRQLTVRNMGSKALKLSLWPNTRFIELSSYGFWLEPWNTKTVGVGIDRSGLQPGLYRDFAVFFLSNAETVGPAGNQDGKIEVEAEVAGPVKVAPLGSYFLTDETPNKNSLIDCGETVNCQFKLVNTDRKVEALNLTVRIVGGANVAGITRGMITHVNNLEPLASVYVPFSFVASPREFDCDSVDGPVFDAVFLVLIYDTFGYSWEQTVKVGVCAPLEFFVVGFEIDDDDQGVSGTVPHVHNKMIECGEIIEARLTFKSNYDLHQVSLGLSDDNGFVYLPGGDSFSYRDVDNLLHVPMCGEVTPDRDFEFRALAYNASPIVFTLTVDAKIAPDIDYAGEVYYPVGLERQFMANAPFGPEVRITTTNPGPRASIHDGFTIHANLRNLGPVDKQVDLYVGVLHQGQIYYFVQGSLMPQTIVAPFQAGVYLSRNSSGPRRIMVFDWHDVSSLPRGELMFAAVLQAPYGDINLSQLWYSFDWVIVNVNY